MPCDWNSDSQVSRGTASVRTGRPSKSAKVAAISSGVTRCGPSNSTTLRPLQVVWMALVQTRLHRVMMRNAIVQPDRRSVQRTALRSTDHHFVRELVHELQAELAGSGDYDGGSGDPRDPYNDPTVGSALPSRIRKAVAALRSARRRIVEDGRDLYEGFTDNG